MERNPLAGKRIALGVTGSIAAYKAVGIASRLTQEGALVDVAMTPEATRLVPPLSFQAITHRPVAADMFELLPDGQISHVAIGRAADLMMVAPATAHTVAKLALGLADDVVSATALTVSSRLLLAPAMESNMWRHPATQGHVEALRSRGWTIVEPESGYLASGARGEGRLADPDRIVDEARRLLARSGDLADWRVAVTAGGTREPIDPVRFISNRSSGKMGYAVAEAARDRGASVTLISTVALPAPGGARVVAVESAREMLDAVIAEVTQSDALVMAAAIADFEPAEPAEQKIKKTERALALELAPIPDAFPEILRLRGQRKRPVLVGFAAETEDLLDNARHKLATKGLDLIVANDVSRSDSGFGSDFNQVTFLRPDGTQRELPLLPKIEVAHRLWDEVLEITGARVGDRRASARRPS